MRRGASLVSVVKAPAVGLLLALTCALPAAAAEDALTPEPARIELLSVDYTAMRLRLALLSGFHQRPERFAFFGDVGPTAGCDELRRLADTIGARDADAFRPEYIAAATSAVPPSFLAGTPQQLLPTLLDANWNIRIAEALARPGAGPILGRGVDDLTRRALAWAAANGYAGRQLGYDAAGRSYWAFNEATPGMVCAVPPAFRAGVLGSWQAKPER